MSSVVSSTVLSDIGTPRRRIMIRVTVENNDLEQHTVDLGPTIAAASFDANAWATKVGNKYLDGLKSGETSVIIDLSETPQDEVSDLAAIQAEIYNKTNSPKWTTNKLAAKSLVYEIMARKEVFQGILSKSVLVASGLVGDTSPTDYVLTNQQVRNFLDITQTKLDNARDKFRDVFWPPGISESGEQITTGNFSSKSEEWE